MAETVFRVKSRAQAEAIADGLSAVQPGLGAYYMRGYAKRRYIECAAAGIPAYFHKKREKEISVERKGRKKDGELSEG